VSTVDLITLMIIAALIVSWRITWLATRVDRANVRAERTWAALDAALVRRAQRALELVLMPDIDPTTALLVSDAANAALKPQLSRHDRERAESDLSHVLDAVGPMLATNSSRLDSERARASISRRLHNDAVATALSLRRKHTVRILQLAGRAAEPRPFEMADGTSTLAAGPPDSPPSSPAYLPQPSRQVEPRAPAVSEAANRHSAEGQSASSRELGWPCDR
jgi:hypothetical protein